MSRAYGRTSYNWCSLLSPNGFHCGRDLDLILDERLLEDLSSLTEIPVQKLQDMQLISYEGKLYPRYDKQIRTITQFHIARTRIKMLLYGLQCCTKCLAEDEIPYWRKQWRLAFVVGCARHEVLLLDSCPACGTRLSLSKRLARQKLTVCRSCTFDLLDYKESLPFREPIVSLQRKLLRMLKTGTVEIEPGIVIHSTEFFSILQKIFKLCSLQHNIKRSSTLLDYFQDKSLVLPLNILSKKNHVERLGVVERQTVMYVVDYLLMGWPNRFIEMYKRNNIKNALHLDKPTGYLCDLISRCELNEK